MFLVHLLFTSTSVIGLELKCKSKLTETFKPEIHDSSNISNFHLPFLFSTIYFYDSILINIFKYVRCVHQDTQCTRSCNNEKYVQLKTIDHHCNVLPVFTYLKNNVKYSLKLHVNSIKLPILF